MADKILILDGGMGRELERMGAPFQQPEWSALALMEGPDFVRQAHLNFIKAGAEVITTNSYALVPFHIGERRFATQGRSLADLAGRLAKQAVIESGRKVKIAGSLPPLFGSYRPDLFEAKRAPMLLSTLIAGLSPHVDLWLAETQGSIAEVRAVQNALSGDGRPLWISFTLKDDDITGPPRLRSGETVEEAAKAALRLNAAALLFNCSQPEVMAAALTVAKGIVGARIPLGCYANAFPPMTEEAEANEGLSPIRADLDPPGYSRFAAEWVQAGATMVGGCCGIGPTHIAALCQAVAKPQA